MTMPIKNLVLVTDEAETQDVIRAYFVRRGYNVMAISLSELRYKTIYAIPCEVILTSNISGSEAVCKSDIERLWSNTPVISIDGSHMSESGAIQFTSLLAEIEKLTAKRQNINSKIIGNSPPFLAVLELVKQVAKSKANIFLMGESGSGKEVIAKLIHEQSHQKDGPFVAINCSAIPENLLESELFGHAKGSFTGAHDKKIGLFEEAENGTLFLDEIGDLSLVLQAKLLRVLQEKKIRRVGENQSRSINARIVSATHKNITNEIKNGNFREDLLFRLKVIPIEVPSLRDRKEDIIPLAQFFLSKFASLNASRAKRFSSESIKYLIENVWRGNVRELENTIERAVVMSINDVVNVQHILPTDCDTNYVETKNDNSVDSFMVRFCGELTPLQEVVQRYIEYAVELNDGAKDKTAKELGIDRKTLYKKMATAKDRTSHSHAV
jgi:two-component system response regulator HydG